MWFRVVAAQARNVVTTPEQPSLSTPSSKLKKLCAALWPYWLVTHPPSVVKLQQHMHAVQHQIASEQAHLVSRAAHPINPRVQEYQWLERESGFAVTVCKSV